MAKVFISYSRKDIEFAKRLTAELQKSKLDFWIDWEGIPPIVDWWREIEKGIEESDAFLFLISPDSIRSKVCGQEIDHAVKNGKRLIPLVISDTKSDVIHPKLTSLNWIFFREKDDFDSSITKLLTSIHTDFDWVEVQRRLQVRALEWERNHKENSFLLRGKDLGDAELQLATNSSKEPYPTDLQREYVFESRKAADRQRRIVASISIAGIVALAALAVFGFYQAGQAANNAATAQANFVAAETAKIDAQNKQILADSNAATAIANEEEAKKQANIARAGELAAQALVTDQPFQSFLFSVESFKLLDTPPQRNSLLTSLQNSPGLITMLHGNQASVWSVAFSPDGKTLAAGTANGTINLWNITDRAIPKQLRSLNSYTKDVWSIAFSPDSKTLAAGTVDQTIVLWDVSDPANPIQLGEPLSGHADDVRSVAFSPDRKTFASAGCGKKDAEDKCIQGEIILWDVSEPAKPKQLGEPLSGHLNDVWSVAFSPDGLTLASASWDNTIILWNVSKPSTPKILGEPLKGHKLPVWSIAFSPRGNILASGSMDKTIILWDVSDPAKPKQLGEPLSGHADEVHSVAFNPDGNILVSGSADHKIIVWDLSHLEAPSQIGLPLAGHTNVVLSVALSANGKNLTLASGSVDKMIIVWDVPIPEKSIREAIQLGEPHSHTDYVWTVGFSPDGNTLASGSIDSTISLWDTTDPARTKKFNDPSGSYTGPVWSIAFSSDEKTLVSGGCGKFDKDTCVQGETILWDVIDRNASKQLVKLTNHTDHVQTVKFSPDGKVLASGSWDKIVILWNVENPANPLQDSIIKFGAIVRTLAFSPDGNTLAIGGDDLTVALWDITNPTAPTQLGELPTKHTNYIWSVAFSPDGKTLASGSLDNTVILWDVTKPKEPIQWGEPLSHPDYVLNVAFSPDKRTLVSTSCEKRDENKNCMQGDIFLWDVSSLATPIQIGQNLKGHTNEITSVAFSPNGKILASGRIAIILWDVDPQSWVVRACQKAGRNFTQPEWEKYFPGEDYRITCPQWPAGE